MHTDMAYISTGYDVTNTNYFWSEVIVKKTVKNATSDGFRWKFLRKV